MDKSFCDRWQTRPLISEISEGWLSRLVGSIDWFIPKTILYFDIDNLYDFNKKHGHDAGDELLRGIWERLIGMLPSNSYALRYGGEEFIAISNETKDEIIGTARKLRSSIENNLSVTISCVCTDVGNNDNDEGDIDKIVFCVGEIIDVIKQRGGNKLYWIDGSTKWEHDPRKECTYHYI